MKPLHLSEDIVPINDLATQGRFIAAVQEGLADVEAGRLLDTEDVDRELDLELGALNP